jgi:acyl carrier protein
MTNEEIISKANKVIDEHLLGDGRTLNTDDNFERDLGADSLDIVELVMAFEEEFNIEIRDDEAEKVETVGNAHDLLLAKLTA